MGEVYQRIKKIATEIVNAHRSYAGYQSLDTHINKYTEILNLGIETISYMKKQEYEKWDIWYIDEWYILRKLLEELLKKELETLETFQMRKSIGRYVDQQKLNELSNLIIQLERIFDNIPFVREEKVNIETINDWIESLKIYKLNGNSLELTYYQTSDDLYQDIEKITLDKQAPTYKKIYAIRVANKLSSEENQSKLPKCINFRLEKWRWVELIRKIQNPSFNFRIQGDYIKAFEDIEVNEGFAFAEWKNNIQLLIKNGKS